MYDGNISDNEIVQFHKKVNVDFISKVVDINQDLFRIITIEEDRLYKIIPLFNCEEIISSNPNDKVLNDNKCLIFIGDLDTVVHFKSNNTVEVLGLYIELIEKDNDTLLQGVVFDKARANPLKDANVFIELYDNDVLTNAFSCDSDEAGQFIQLLTDYDEETVNVRAYYENLSVEKEV